MDKLEFNKEAEQYPYSENFWNIVSSGLCFNPSEYLVRGEDGEKVKEAIATLMEFELGMWQNDLFDEM